MDAWINKMWYMHTTEYYSVIKENEVLLSVTVWMDLERIMLRGKKPVRER